MSKSDNEVLLNMMLGSKEVFEFVKTYLDQNDSHYSEIPFFEGLETTLSLSSIWEQVHEALRLELKAQIVSGYKERDLDRIDMSEDYIYDMICDEDDIDGVMMQSIFSPVSGVNSEEVCKAFEESENISTSWDDLNVLELNMNEAGLLSPTYEISVRIGKKKGQKGQSSYKPVIVSYSSQEYLQLVNEIVRLGIDGNGISSKKSGPIVEKFISLLMDTKSSKLQEIISRYRSDIDKELGKIEKTLKVVRSKRASLKPEIIRFKALEQERDLLLSKMQKELKDLGDLGEDIDLSDLINDS